MCRRIGQNGERFIKEGAGILTHCNAGALATAGQGTALSVMFEAHKNGKKFRVYADETRPLLQGARLTAWELKQAGIDVTVICDNTAAYLMKQGRVDAVITGAYLQLEHSRPGARHTVLYCCAVKHVRLEYKKWSRDTH
jgi:methylthioribose-1-phosphate isomerase